MRMNILNFMLVFFVITPAWAGNTATGQSPQAMDFIGKYVHAINQKDLPDMRDLMAPVSRKCLNQDNQKYFDDVMAAVFKYSITGSYKGRIEPIEKYELDLERRKANLNEKLGLKTPLMPGYRMYVDFELNQNHFYQITKDLILDKGQYFEVYECPDPEWVEEYFKRKADPLEQRKYEQKLMALLKDEAAKVPFKERDYFLENEYGMIFTSNKSWQNSWLFKTKSAFRSLKIVLTGPEGEKTLADNIYVKDGYTPLQFSFYLGKVEPVQMGKEINLRASYGFSRTGGFAKPQDHPIATSAGFELKGETVKEVTLNKTASDKDVLNVSGDMMLADIKTQSGDKTIDYYVTLKVQAEGSYRLAYGYKTIDGKFKSFLTTGEKDFLTYKDLKEWASQLPAATKLSFAPGCRRLGNEPLSSESEINEFKKFCVENKIELTIIPSG